MGNPRKTNTGLTHAQTSTFRCIGKYNTQIIVLENDQNVKLWDWCLMNAIKAEDDPSQQMLNAYNGSGIRGTNKRSSEILRCSNLKANARCVALLQSSLSERGLHLIMDLHDVYTMRRRLMDVFGNLQRGQEDSPVLLLLQFQQNQRTLKEYVTEMKRRMEVCKMFDVHLTVREQILALIEGLNSGFTTAVKGQMIEELIENSEGMYGHGFDDEMEIILQFLKGKQKSV